MNSDRILIIDCASQYSQLIARTVRELGVYSEILFWDVPIEKIKEINPSGIIITGDMQSLYERDAPNISKEILSLDIPIFGIGYGMTLIAKMLGGKIKEGKAGEYKKENITIKGDTLLSD
jgi:GMP synthase (glutamine-hydrolysing)